MDGDQRLAGDDERGSVCAGSSREVLPQGHDRKEADDADDDYGGFKDTSGDIAEGDAFALPLDDGPQRDGGADVGDGKDDLEEPLVVHLDSFPR
jgi:hypothetical protein